MSVMVEMVEMVEMVVMSLTKARTFGYQHAFHEGRIGDWRRHAGAPIRDASGNVAQGGCLSQTDSSPTCLTPRGARQYISSAVARHGGYGCRVCEMRARWSVRTERCGRVDVREFNRRQMAAARSRRATPEELREARERLKEIEAELQRTELLPETKNGEEREQRYERILRLRAMRDEFARKVPPQKPHHANGILLSLFMLVGSVVICAVCAGGSFFALRFVTQKPDPTATSNGFWDDMKAQDYVDLHENLLYPTLRVQRSTDVFVSDARATDALYGKVTNAQLVSVPGDATQVENVKITYAVTRGNNVRYNVTLTLQLHTNTWGISDFGSTFAPSGPGVPNIQPTPTPNPEESPTATPVSDRGGGRPIADLPRRRAG